MKKIAIMSIPYSISIALTIVLGIIFSSEIIFGYIPIIVIIALVIEAVIMMDKDTVDSSNMSSGDLNRAEVNNLHRVIGQVTLYTVPFLFPLIIFFDATVKSILSFGLWALTYGVGFALFRIKYGKQIKGRIIEEAKELAEQSKLEEQGII